MQGVGTERDDFMKVMRRSEGEEVEIRRREIAGDCFLD